MEHNRCRSLLGLLLLLFIAGCGEKSAAPEPAAEALPTDSHERMLAVLAQIRDRNPDPKPFVGNTRLLAMQADLEKLGDNASPEEIIRVNSQLGLEWILHGEMQKAVDHLQLAYDLMEKSGAKVDTRNREFVIYTLGLAYLRLGEAQNCVHCNNGASCILPIQAAAVHTKKRGSEGAVEYFEKLLKENSERLDARWLLNVAYMTLAKHPQGVPKEFLVDPKAFESEEPTFPKFPNVAAQLGLDRVNLCGGVIVDDFDGDELLDIVLSDWNKNGQMLIFHNDGEGGFVDQTEHANLKGIYGGLNINQADYDNDGDLDVLVLRGAWMGKHGRDPKSLLQNDGHGKFRDVTFDAGLGDVYYPTQTAGWFDFDKDGDLDLYVGSEKHVGTGPKDPPEQYPSQLFRNNGNGTFTEIAAAAGVENNRFCKGVSCGDYDSDGDPDIYVSNLNDLNRLYRNNGDGTFSDVAGEARVQLPKNSFPTWFWDYNNDGNLDIMVFSYDTTVSRLAAEYLDRKFEGEPDHLYQGDGKGQFRDVTAEQNLVRQTAPMGSNFGDLDYDGFPDMYLGTGYQAFDGLMPNLMFHNLNLKGKGFAEVSAAAGTAHLQKGHGVAFADLDQDGDQDIFIEMGGAYLGDAFHNCLFENPGFGNHWLVLRLKGTKSNRSAIGTRIRADIVENGTKRSIYKWVNSGGSFGANPLRQEMGLGAAERVERLEIFWPTTGQTQVFENVAANQSIEITEGEQEFKVRPWKTTKFSGKPQVSLPVTAAAVSPN